MTFTEMGNKIAHEFLGAPVFVIEEAIRDAVINLCEMSNCYQVQSDPVTLDGKSGEVPLQIPGDTRLVRVLSVRYGTRGLDQSHQDDLDRTGFDWETRSGEPTVYVQTQPDLIQVVPFPMTEIKPLRVRLSVCPLRSSVEVDDLIAERFENAIVAGAKANLFNMQAPWGNPRMYQVWDKEATKEINRARLEFGLDNGRAHRTVTMRSV